ncbi:FUSC family protein [Trinickia terrae]|uniref:FUSC family protein n=1 Tax=Trinickia terrae TaxID=2571161 RepID=UPI001F0CE993|nr:FUSC family protein [Trinickia terrae]
MGWAEPFVAHAVEVSRDAALALARELAAWRASRERVAFAAKVTCSVALAVLAAHALHLSNTWWAAITGYTVMQSSLAGSVLRGFHRVLGTVLGALVGALAGTWTGGLPWLFVPVLGVFGGACVYRAIGSQASYAWILGAITALMVAFQAHILVTMKASAAFAALRVIEVIVGTLACVAVSAMFHLGGVHRGIKWREQGWGVSWAVHRAWLARVAQAVRGKFRPAPAAEETAAPSPSPAAPSALGSAPVVTLDPPSFQAARKRLAMQAGVSVAILAALAYVLDLPGFAQAMVTTIAVVALPAASIADDTTRPVLEKMIQRFVGCLLAGVIAVALLPLLRGETIPCMIALVLGVWAGCHLQTGKEGASYVGRQFTIAFIMVFVQDHHWSADPKPALLRLAGILTGIVVISGVMLATAGRVDGATPRT